MSYQQPNHRAHSNFNLRILDLLKHFLEKRHENTINERITNIWVYNDGFEILQGADLFVNGCVTGNGSIHVT